MYERAITTFIDILGFRELVRSRPAEGVAKVIDVFRDFSGDPKGDDPLGLRVVGFSDSIIRSRPESAVSGVFYELLDLLHAQGELVGKGVLVRGGVAFGDIAWQQDRVFGPGFIEAYEMESKFAVYPRIAVSPSLLAAFSSGSVPFVHHHDLAEEASYVRSLLAQGDDGVWYIDYLRAFRSELDEPELYPDYLSDHRNLIIGLADALKKNGPELSSLALKANWLARYHNAVVGELDARWFSDLDVDKDDLLVPRNALPTLFSFEGISSNAR